jgi:condensin complex subunit 3
VFVDHCISTNDDRRLESALPVVTSLAFRIQAAYNELLEDIQAEQADELLGGVDEEQRAKNEEARLAKEFVIAEMCKLAVNLDYADEIGRRKMFQLVRES